MKKLFIPCLIAATIFTACDSDDDQNTVEEVNVEAPASYEFTREGLSTVSFSGQTTRILMAEETAAAFTDFDNTTEASLQAMFAHVEGANDFEDADLNASDKSVRSKIAASNDYFNANSAESTLIKTTFENYISTQVNEVFPNQNVLAEAGVAGQIADGGSTRYVTGKGLEMNQTFTKGAIGALMTDQMLNHYLGTGVLDEADNRENNDNDITEEGKSYTSMEHKWDEAYGYLFGASPNEASPLATLGDDDSFLNKYLGRVEGDLDFAGIGQEVFDALKLGRAAIVAKNYEVRDAQAAVIRQRISEVIAIRSVFYLQNGKTAIEAGEFGTAFHDLSEGFGFIYSLRFTRNNQSGDSFFTRSEVDGFINDIMNDGPDGLWDVTPATLDAISDAIAAPFSFTVAEAASTN